MSKFAYEVKKIEKQIQIHGYDPKAQKEFIKIWRSLNK
jgi:hypothetical protein